MKMKRRLNKKGVTLIELLIALVILGMVAGGIYQVFIAQSKAYTVQEQVSEVQQSVRTAMDIILRDLRMAGYDSDHPLSTVTIPAALANISDSSIMVNYEYYDKTLGQYQKHTIAYWRDPATSSLMRQLTVNDVATPQETILENVETFHLTYGVDVDDDASLDKWVPAAQIGSSKVIAVRVSLSARPAQTNPEVQKISPRTLVSNVTLRNVCMLK